MVLVYLAHAGGRWTTYDAHYLPGPESPVSRISEPANYRESAADPLDRSVVCAEIPCAAGADPIWRAGRRAGELVRDTGARVGLPPVRRRAVVTKRLPTSTRSTRSGYGANLRGVDAWAVGLPRSPHSADSGCSRTTTPTTRSPWPTTRWTRSASGGSTRLVVRGSGTVRRPRRRGLTAGSPTPAQGSRATFHITS